VKDAAGCEKVGGGGLGVMRGGRRGWVLCKSVQEMANFLMLQKTH